MSAETGVSGDARRERLFFALWPDAAIRLGLIEAAARLLASGTARRIAVADLHLTLAFLGAVDAAARRCFEQAASSVQAGKFSLTIDRAGCWTRRSIAWAGPSKQPAGLALLVARLNAALAGCGFKPETRPYRAHITLARNARRAKPRLAITPLRWDIDRFCLIVSRPPLARTAPASGRYEVLRYWNLD